MRAMYLSAQGTPCSWLVAKHAVQAAVPSSKQESICLGGWAALPLERSRKEEHFQDVEHTLCARGPSATALVQSVFVMCRAGQGPL